METYKSALPLLRRRAGLSLAELSEATQMSRSKLMLLETGKKPLYSVPLQTALVLAHALNCRPEDLLVSAAEATSE